ncbi:MAG: LCP family protein [Solirubrobacterales bacterium]|nr:LCP family protein [Solirubrobacterales bacterium]
MTEFDENEEHEETPVDGADSTPEAPAPGEYVEQPTEELFALEARLKDGDDVPELDPIFRAALFESSESAIAEPEEPEAAEPPAPETEAPVTDHGEEPATGDFEPTGEHEIEEEPTGTHEWEPPSETDITSEQTAVLQATARSEVHDAIEFSRRTGRSWDPPRPPVGGDFQQPAKRRRYWWRFLLATVLIIGSFAGATQASVMHIFNGIAKDLNKNQGQKLPGWLVKQSDGPQTIVLIGSDVRTGGGDTEGDPGRSDTTMLIRLDPDTDQIAMLSIPRDLYVDIPGHGYDKFNAAFTYGGTKLTLQTIKELTGLEINHVVNVDFQGFADVIDSIGCVYMDVDRKYFNDNVGVPVSEQYAAIDIDAGYQKLCGADALEFARYRHTDSDLVRAARQQDLIGEIRNRLGFGEVLKRRDELLKAFTQNTSSDISNADQIFQLLKLLFDSRGAAVTEVSFPSTFTMRDGISYVEATPSEIDGAVQKFLGFQDEPGPVAKPDEGESPATKANNEAQRRKERKAAKARKKELNSSTTNIPSKEEDGLVDDAADGVSLAAQLDSEITRTDFPVFYPKRLPSNSYYADGSRVYHTRDPDKNVYGAYRMVMALETDGTLEYFGLQGLRGWTDPPILEAPHEEVTMDDRKFQVYYEGDRIKLVSWTDGDNVYWVTNTLLLTLENEQMLGIARSTRAFTPGK